MGERVCVLCERPWVLYANRCECGGFCTWSMTREEAATARVMTPDAARANAAQEAMWKRAEQRRVSPSHEEAT